MGPPLRTFFDGEKPALVQQLNVEFDKVQFSANFELFGIFIYFKRMHVYYHLISYFYNLITFPFGCAWLLQQLVYRSDTPSSHSRERTQKTN